MVGYNWGEGMSNNAVQAYKEGKMPLSHWTKKELIKRIEELYKKDTFTCPIEVLRKKKKSELQQLLEYTEWHHASKFYNCVDFYEVSVDLLKELDETASQITLPCEQKEDMYEECVYEIVVLGVANWSGKHRANDTYHAGILFRGWIYSHNHKFRVDAKRVVSLSRFKTISDLNLYLKMHPNMEVESDMDFLSKRIEELKHKYPDIELYYEESAKHDFDKHFLNKMKKLEWYLSEEDFNSCFAYASEDYFRELYAKNKDDAIEILVQIYKKNDIHAISGILHILSHFEYQEIPARGQNIAAKALTHKNPHVVMYALKCFDNWGDKNALEIVKKVHYPEDWLQEIADKIVESIEGETSCN